MDIESFISWVDSVGENYSPSDRVRQELASVDLVAIVGPTGVGKTSIIKKLNMQEVLSDVTRPIRDGEKDGKDYYFRDDYIQIMQEIKSGEYVQFLLSSSNYFYGTRRQSYPNSGKCVMAIYANQIERFKTLGFRSIRIFFIMPPGYVEWMRRVGVHQPGDLHKRLDEAKQSIET